MWDESFEESKIGETTVARIVAEERGETVFGTSAEGAEFTAEARRREDAPREAGERIVVKRMPTGPLRGAA